MANRLRVGNDSSFLLTLLNPDRGGGVRCQAWKDSNSNDGAAWYENASQLKTVADAIDRRISKDWEIRQERFRTMESLSSGVDSLYEALIFGMWDAFDEDRAEDFESVEKKVEFYQDRLIKAFAEQQAADTLEINATDDPPKEIRLLEPNKDSDTTP